MKARTPYSTDVTDSQWKRILSLIPPAKTGGRPRSVDMREVINALFYLTRTGFVVLPKRWVVERTFAWLGKYRRLSKDYEILEASSEAFVYLAMILLMLKRLN